MSVDLMQLLDLLGGRSTPPAQGGPTPPDGMPYPAGMMGGNQNAMAALAGIGMQQMMNETRKLAKAENTVGMQMNKPQQVDPNAPGIGPADLQARGAMVANQQSPQGGPPGMGGPQMPPGGGGPAAMLQMLMQQRGGM